MFEMKWNGELFCDRIRSSFLLTQSVLQTEVRQSTQAPKEWNSVHSARVVGRDCARVRKNDDASSGERLVVPTFDEHAQTFDNDVIDIPRVESQEHIHVATNMAAPQRPRQRP